MLFTSQEVCVLTVKRLGKDAWKNWQGSMREDLVSRAVFMIFGSKTREIYQKPEALIFL